MSPREIWITPGKHLPADLDGETIEMDVLEQKPNRAIYKTQGLGRIRIQYYSATSGKVCIWVMFYTEPPYLPYERAMDIIDEHHTVRHPDQSKAHYLCKLSYSSGEESSARA